MISSFLHTPATITDDYSASNAAQPEHVVSLVCTEVAHYNISSRSIRAALLQCPYLLKKCADYFKAVSEWAEGEGGGRGGEDERISVELWMSHSEQILSSPSLKCFYHCSHLKFLWTPQGTVIYRTIKYNLHGYSFLNHELTNCSDVLDRAG